MRLRLLGEHARAISELEQREEEITGQHGGVGPAYSVAASSSPPSVNNLPELSPHILVFRPIGGNALFRLDQQPGPGGPWQPARQGGKDESIGLVPADNLHLAFKDADLVAQHQQLGLISGPVAKGCEARSMRSRRQA